MAATQTNHEIRNSVIYMKSLKYDSKICQQDSDLTLLCHSFKKDVHFEKGNKIGM